MVLCVVVWFWYPETKGRSLEEIAIVFDGEDEATGEEMERGVYEVKYEDGFGKSSVEKSGG